MLCWNSLKSAYRFGDANLRFLPQMTANLTARQTVVRQSSSLQKILKRELKHDMDSGSTEMPENLSELKKVIEETMVLKETPGEARVQLVSKKGDVTVTFDIRVRSGGAFRFASLRCLACSWNEGHFTYEGHRRRSWRATRATMTRRKSRRARRRRRTRACLCPSSRT